MKKPYFLFSCKYCHVPFEVWQTGEDSYEIECPKCGCNVG